MELKHAYIGKGEHRFFVGSKQVAEVTEVNHGDEGKMFYPAIVLDNSERKRGNRLPSLESCKLWISETVNKLAHAGKITK